MNDPHVESLEYRFVSDPTRVYDNPPPLEGEAGAFNWRLADHLLTVTMKEHHATEAEARAVVDAFVRAWELDSALKYGRREVRFDFERAKVIDRAPPPGIVLRAGPARVVGTGHVATLRVTHRKYPEPPAAFSACWEVETLWLLYERYKNNRDALGRVAFLCLELAEGACGRGDRKRTAAALGISDDVLDRLANLTTNKGDAYSARRLPVRGLQPFAASEVAWMEKVMLEIIRRLGERASGVEPAPRLTMGDLPKL